MRPVRDLNRTVLTGGVVQTPSLRRSQAGTPVATVRLAFTTRRRIRGGWQNKPNYIDIEVWGRQAEVAASHLHRGHQVAIDGRIELDEYETKDGNKRRVHKIIADQVRLFPSSQPDASAPKEAVAGTAASVPDEGRQAVGQA